MCEMLPTATFVSPGRSMRVKFTTADKTMQNHHATQIKVLWKEDFISEKERKKILHILK